MEFYSPRLISTLGDPLAQMYCESISMRPWRVLRRALESGALFRMLESIDRIRGIQ